MTPAQSAGLEQRARELLAKWRADGRFYLAGGEGDKSVAYDACSDELEDALAAAPAADGVLDAHTMINHEREPHCIGCYVIRWNNGDPVATCNECGVEVLLLDQLSSGWMGIASAPRDREILLVGGTYCTDGGGSGMDDSQYPLKNPVIGSWRDGSGWFIGYGNAYNEELWAEPALWRPLPAAPQAQGEG